MLRCYAATLLHGEARDERWHVWTAWYEARLNGAASFDADLEKARILEIAETDWEEGPTHVNRLIEEIEARFHFRDVKIPPVEPETPVQMNQALSGPFLTLSVTDFTFVGQVFDAAPFDADAINDPVTDPVHADLLATLKWAAYELERLATRNKLGIDDARRCADYVSHLDAPVLNARLLHLVARALLAEAKAAEEEGRLASGDAQIARDFSVAHFALLSRFYSGVLQVEEAADDARLINDASLEAIAQPLHRLPDILRDAGDLVTEELRAAFDELDRISQGELRAAQLDALAEQNERERFTARFATRVVATVGRFYVTVKKHAMEITAVGSGLAGMEATWGTVTRLWQRIKPIWDALSPYVPFL